MAQLENNQNLHSTVPTEIRERKAKYRRFWRRAVFILIFFEFLNASFHAASLYDRHILHNEVAISHSELSARSRIAITIINATRDNRALQPEEMAEIKKLWQIAGYEKIAPPPF